MDEGDRRANLILDQIDDLGDMGNPTALRIRTLAWLIEPEHQETDFQRALLREIRRLIDVLNEELGGEWRLRPC